MAKKRGKATVIKELAEAFALAYAAEIEYEQYSHQVRELKNELYDITQQEVNA